MASMDLMLASVCLPVILYVWLSRSKWRPSLSVFPPGPKPRPIIGNLLDMATKEIWLPATKWAKDFGPIVYLHIFNINILYVNTAEAANDLLERRGAIYSGRPKLVMAGELCGCEHMVVFTTYNARFRRLRTLLNKALSPSAITSYEPLILSETRSFLSNLHHSPQSFIKHIRHYSGSIGLSVVYGHEAKSTSDPFLSILEECLWFINHDIASGGGIWLVDIFPILKRLPNWMPGAGFKRKAEKWKQRIDEFADKPYELLKENMISGSYKPSFCSTLLEEASLNEEPADTDEERQRQRNEFEFDLKWAANSMYSSTTDANLAAVTLFMLAIISHPSAQKAAQAEIDAVVGNDRLPDFQDREKLVYLEALYKECLRWGIPVPLTLAHRAMKDDVYKGMYIPEGTFVFGNIWSMLRDPEVYRSPESFIPERFLEPCTPEEEMRRDPRIAFGFGRRICPGMHLVDSSIWLLMANMLAVFDFSNIKDEHGVEQEIKVEFNNPIFRIPTEFKCDITPRNEKALILLGQLEIAGA